MQLCCACSCTVHFVRQSDRFSGDCACMLGLFGGWWQGVAKMLRPEWVCCTALLHDMSMTLLWSLAVWLCVVAPLSVVD
jgi:hypothetical protein